MSKKVLKRAVKLCLENAEQYIKDAELLIKNESYGHAFALTVLAEEEAAKVWIYYLCVQGILGVHGDWTKDILKHRIKQSFAFMLTLMYKVGDLIYEIQESVEKMAEANSKKAKEIVLKKMRNFQERMVKSVTYQRGEFYESLKWFKGMQREKEKALYVDVNIERKRLSSPKTFNKSEVRKYLSQVEKRLEMTKEGVNRPMIPSVKEYTKSLMRDFLRSCNEEQRRKWLRWYGLSP